MSLRDKWVNAFYKAAIGTGRARSRLTPLLVTVVSSSIWLLFFVSLKVDRFLNFPPLPPAPVNIILSVTLITLGLLLAIWSVIHFHKVKGTPIPSNPPPKLVTSGPYAHVRNPMHIGFYIVFFGVGILLRSISTVAIFMPVLILFDTLELKAIEEPELEKRLGKEYLEYKKKVPMFIPRLKQG